MPQSSAKKLFLIDYYSSISPQDPVYPNIRLTGQARFGTGSDATAFPLSLITVQITCVDRVRWRKVRDCFLCLRAILTVSASPTEFPSVRGAREGREGYWRWLMLIRSRHFRRYHDEQLERYNHWARSRTCTVSLSGLQIAEIANVPPPLVDCA